MRLGVVEKGRRAAFDELFLEVSDLGLQILTCASACVLEVLNHLSERCLVLRWGSVFFAREPELRGGCDHHAAHGVVFRSSVCVVDEGLRVLLARSLQLANLNDILAKSHVLFEGLAIQVSVHLRDRVAQGFAALHEVDRLLYIAKVLGN